ncbi:C40 family peptidase [Oryzicola mucosus]|uniref:C40 family peptidase n=1 Tax=Oryzicola mucosus TaxID=2767425 RepID=A0A8J6PLN6_9HYPH|nr:NlpC/P60 family protein [Oryzicola mucosus]MBD0413385.1 C40 family peptidase [Oryzicola mucosus]
MTVHDTRLHAFRRDLADIRLEGKVQAERFVEGRAARIGASIVDVLAAPRVDAGVNTQFLLGEDVLVFEEGQGFAWVQSLFDGYVGYVQLAALGANDAETTHVVVAPRTFLYPGPDLKLPRGGVVSMGSRVTVVDRSTTRGTEYAHLSSGKTLVAAHLAPIGDYAADYVSVAERLVETPYLWGGASGFGIDCSGLVQLSMRMAGRSALRDSDMQAAGLGTPLQPGKDYSGLQRGDLVFWKGHVAVMTDAESMIHANGHTMSVAREGLHAAIDRIGYLYGAPTGFRRP